MRTTGIPLPRPTELSRPHWDGCRQGELLVQRCGSCHRYVFIPEAVCPGCLSSDLVWARSSGRGSVHSFSIVYRPAQPAFEVPYVVAIVELEEGFHMFTNIVGCKPEVVCIGMPVEVEFQRMSDEITLPMFRPTSIEQRQGVGEASAKAAGAR